MDLNIQGIFLEKIFLFFKGDRLLQFFINNQRIRRKCRFAIFSYFASEF